MDYFQKDIAELTKEYVECSKRRLPDELAFLKAIYEKDHIPCTVMDRFNFLHDENRYIASTGKVDGVYKIFAPSIVEELFMLESSMIIKNMPSNFMEMANLFDYTQVIQNFCDKCHKHQESDLVELSNKMTYIYECKNCQKERLS